ncbi:hypothetical protein JCM10212_004407 [Sporobolomyces blumeae]
MDPTASVTSFPSTTASPSTFAASSFDAFAFAHPVSGPFADSSVPPVSFSYANSPRSRTHSTASSVSSFASSSRSSYVGETSPDTSADHFTASGEHSTSPTTLALDGLGNGLVVFDNHSMGQLSVSWDQLVQFLVDPRTSASLHPDHPISRASALLGSLPISAHQYGHSLVAKMSDNLGGFTFDSTHEAKASNMTSFINDDMLESPQTAHPFRSSFGPLPGPTFALPTEPLPPLPLRSIDPREFAQEYTGVAVPPLAPFELPPDAIATLPTPPARFTSRPPSLNRSESDYSPQVGRRELVRNAAAPYPRRGSFYQQPHLSTSSLQDYAGSQVASSSASFRSLNERQPSQPTVQAHDRGDAKSKKRGLRALNRESERYAWNRNKGQLFRVPAKTSDGDLVEEVESDTDGEKRIVPMEIIVFPPGSYYKVVEDELEILPSDNNARVNTWLRSQTCVTACHFRFEGKRPSVIRQHVASCKARARQVVGSDPLKRLCELQLASQSSIVRHHVFEPLRTRTADSWADVPPARSSCGTDSDAGDDRSTHSFESGGSAPRLSERRGRRPPSFVGSIASPSSHNERPDPESSNENRETWWQTKPASNMTSSPSSWNETTGDSSAASEEAVEAMIASSGASSSGCAPGDDADMTTTAQGDDDWLTTYGLKTPMVASAFARQQEMTSGQPVDGDARRRASFLAMDD